MDDPVCSCPVCGGVLDEDAPCAMMRATEIYPDRPDLGGTSVAVHPSCKVARIAAKEALDDAVG